MIYLILFWGGLAAGLLGGLLGIGGGIVLMPILRFTFGLTPPYAAGTCIAAVFFTTLAGGYRHYRPGHFNFRSLIPVVIPGAAMTVVFSLIFHRHTDKSAWMDLAIGLVFLLVSAWMFLDFRRDMKHVSALKPQRAYHLPGSNHLKASIGMVGGVLPGLLGIGTIWGANLGGFFNGGIHERRIKLLFALVFLDVSAKFICSFGGYRI